MSKQKTSSILATLQNHTATPQVKAEEIPAPVIQEKPPTLAITKRPRGRQKKSEALKPTSIAILPSEDDLVKEMAEKLGVTTNSLMRYLVINGIKQLKDGTLTLPTRQKAEIQF